MCQFPEHSSKSRNTPTLILSCAKALACQSLLTREASSRGPLPSVWFRPTAGSFNFNRDAEGAAAKWFRPLQSLTGRPRRRARALQLRFFIADRIPLAASALAAGASLNRVARPHESLLQRSSSGTRLNDCSPPPPKKSRYFRGGLPDHLAG